MKSEILTILATTFLCSQVCANDKIGRFTALLKTPPEAITRQKATAMLGAPQKVDSGRKATEWQYKYDKTQLTIRWKAGSPIASKVTLNNKQVALLVYDYKNMKNLKEGKLNVPQAINTLGLPSQMNVGTGKQVLRYSYKNGMLRLFFRNNLLVDFSLVEKGGSF